MIDDYVEQLRLSLRVSHRRRRRILDDVRDHLDDAAAELRRAGVDALAADQQAIAAFGSFTDIAAEFNRQAATTSLRRAPLLMGVAGVAVLTGFLVAAAMQPAPGLPKPTGLGRQLAFFAGTVGVQVAVVAGARVLARTAARRRSDPSDDDFRLVRRAVAIFLGGLIAGVAGWAIALIDAVGTSGEARLVPLIAGAALMTVGTVIAIGASAPWRRTVPADSRPTSQLDASALAWPERVIQWAAMRPVVTCTATASVAALAAMSRAETTVVAALPWGAAEGALVVLGYALLGPALELRT